MQTLVHCIVLRIVRHSDTTTIVTVWSRELGRLTFAVPAGSSREARRRRALMMPMSLVEGVAQVRREGELAKISDVRPLGGADVSSDPLKSMVSMFLADFLNAVLRESQPDERLSDFIFESVMAMAVARGTAFANFHLLFMCRLCYFLGIAPDYGTYRRGRCFDMREGVFTATAPLHHEWVDASEARYLHVFAQAPYGRAGSFRMTREQRNRFMDKILNYITLHHIPVNQLNSIAIVRDVLK